MKIVKHCILLAILPTFLLVLAGSLEAEDIPGHSGNVLIIERGPITFSSEKRNQTINFEVPAEYLEGCVSIQSYVASRKLVYDKAYHCIYSYNGNEVGGSLSSIEGTKWHISGTSVGLAKIHAGKNQITVEFVEYKAIKPEITTYDCQAGGIALYFSKEEGEDIGLLDYINYGESKSPGNGATKKSCWVIGNAHTHSTASDGSNTLEESAYQAIGLSHDFRVFTDHYVQIDKPVKSPGTYYEGVKGLSKPEVGFANYVRKCQNITSDGYFVAVAGAEFNTPWRDNEGNSNFAHTLCLGDIQKTDALNGAQGKEGKQAELISAINGVGLSVAAHPNLITTTSFTQAPWKGVRYLFDTRSQDKYTGLDGIGIGNTVTQDQDDANMAFFMKLMVGHQPVFPIGDCDSHGWGDKDDAKKLRRLTGVRIQGLLDKNSLLKAIKEGHVWASIENVRIVESNPIPGFEKQIVDSAKFLFTLAGLPNKVKCQMYRDGQPIPESIQVVSPESPTYSWTDENCPKRETWYNFRVLPNYLVTAPIIIQVRI